jgi:hypothetical protein
MAIQEEIKPSLKKRINLTLVLGKDQFFSANIFVDPVKGFL